MGKHVAFNVNEYVSVKIKPEGFALWKAQHDVLFRDFPHLRKPLTYYEAQVGPDGRVKMQMHEFMRLFGGVCIGFDLPYETNIWLSKTKKLDG